MSSDDEDDPVDPEVAVKAKKRGGRKKKPAQTAGYEEYSDPNLVKFISAVEEYEALWDSSDSNYHRKEYRTSAYDKIELKCSEFMTRGKVHGRVAERVWKSLVDAYKAERKKAENPASGSGVRTQGFKFMTEMDFIEKDRSRREVKNAFVIGGEQTTTPAADPTFGSQKRYRKADKFDVVAEHMAEGNETFKRAVDKLFANATEEPAPTTKEACKSSKICTIYQHVIENLSEFEKISVESSVLTFLFKIKDDLAKKHNYVSMPPPNLNPQLDNFDIPPLYQSL